MFILFGAQELPLAAIITGVLGGLALFLFGMSQMTAGMAQDARDRSTGRWGRGGR